jgi:hypothetical protein
MHLALWIATALLALVALAGGISKTFVPKEKLVAAPGGEWTGHFGSGFVKTLGVLELLATVGLILPAVLGIAMFMVPVTALCWMLLMIGAMMAHILTGSPKAVIVNVVYFGLAAFIAWGRSFGAESFIG